MAKKRLMEVCDVRKPSDKEELETFDAKKFEADVFKEMTEDIENYFAGKELDEKKLAVQNKVAKKLKEKYFKNGLPKDVPWRVRDAMEPDREEKCCKVEAECSCHPRGITLSDEDIKKLQTEVKKMQKRQNEIIELTLNKEKYLENKNLIGSYVSEYKKLEGLKSNYIDRLQSAYLHEPCNFDNYFCEMRPVDADHRF